MCKNLHNFDVEISSTLTVCVYISDDPIIWYAGDLFTTIMWQSSRKFSVHKVQI